MTFFLQTVNTYSSFGVFMKRLMLYLSIIVFIVFLVITMVSSQGSASDDHSDYTIADTTGDWAYPTPYGMYPRGPGYVRMSLIFDTLIWKDEQGLTSALATEWNYEKDNNAYVFSLRDDVEWHDGEAFTAEDVAFTFRYIKRHPWAWIDASVIEEVAVLDEHSVRVVLSRISAPFLVNIAGTLPILPKHIWENVDSPEDFRGKQAVIGTGPFRLANYDKTQGTYLYKAFDEYYGGTPKVDRLRFVKYTQQMSAAGLRRGSVDAAAVPAESVNELEKDGFVIMEEPPVWAAKLMINHRRSPLSSKEFRRALAHAVNKQRIVDIIRRGHADPGAPGLLPPANTYWHNPDVSGYSHKPEESKRLLKNLGYTKNEQGVFAKNDTPITLRLLCSEGSQHSFGRLAEMLAKQFENIGINVKTRSLERMTLDAKIKNWDFDIAISGHGGLGGDPEILNKVILGEGFNSARYRKDEKLTSLLEKQLATMKKSERKELVYKIQEQYAAEVPALTLYHPQWYWARTGEIELFYTNGGLASGIPLPLNKLALVE